MTGIAPWWCCVPPVAGARVREVGRLGGGEYWQDRQTLLTKIDRGRGGTGRHKGLERKLSAPAETPDVEPLKFGESFRPRQADADPEPSPPQRIDGKV